MKLLAAGVQKGLARFHPALQLHQAPCAPQMRWHQHWVERAGFDVASERLFGLMFARGLIPSIKGCAAQAGHKFHWRRVQWKISHHTTNTPLFCTYKVASAVWWFHT